MTEKRRDNTGAIAFIRARLTEDMAYCRTEQILREGDPYYTEECSRWESLFTPDRALRDAESKLYLLDKMTWLDFWPDVACLHTDAIQMLLRPYLDHPDFKSDWFAMERQR